MCSFNIDWFSQMFYSSPFLKRTFLFVNFYLYKFKNDPIKCYSVQKNNAGVTLNDHYDPYKDR